MLVHCFYFCNVCPLAVFLPYEFHSNRLGVSLANMYVCVCEDVGMVEVEFKCLIILQYVVYSVITCRGILLCNPEHMTIYVHVLHLHMHNIYVYVNVEASPLLQKTTLMFIIFHTLLILILLLHGASAFLLAHSVHCQERTCKLSPVRVDNNV